MVYDQIQQCIYNLLYVSAKSKVFLYGHPQFELLEEQFEEMEEHINEGLQVLRKVRDDLLDAEEAALAEPTLD